MPSVGSYCPLSYLPVLTSEIFTSAEDERVFLLDQGLSFRSGILDGDVTFAWRDLSGDPGDMWEFVVNSKSVPKATSGVFEMTVLQCMYERVSWPVVASLSKALD
jgi:hypothetical protein